MRYEPPFGSLDENAPYINGNRAAGIQGSIPSAASIENHQRELAGFIFRSGFTPNRDDLNQVLKAERSQAVNYAIDSGPVNELSIALIPPIEEYTIGLPLHIRVFASNDGPATLDTGAGRFPLTRNNGEELQEGDLVAGGIVSVLWNGTKFQLAGASVLTLEPAPPLIFNIQIPYAVDTSTQANNVVVTYMPAITHVEAGDIIEVRLANTITGTTPVLIYVNALPPVPIKDRWGGDLGRWEAIAGEIIVLLYHPSEYWQILATKPRDRTRWIYNQAGEFVWPCPSNTREVEVEVWGAGASGTNKANRWYAGSGGPSGGYAWGVYEVNPGQDYQVRIGAGGARTSGAFTASNGETSSFDSLIAATGGQYLWVPFTNVAGVLTRDDPTGAYKQMPTYQINPGRGIGGLINLYGGQPFMQMGYSESGIGWVPGAPIWYWNSHYGHGAAAPRGGGTVSSHTNGTWPGGGGGGGSFDGTAGSLLPGAGADGGMIIKARG